jgi:hypothetical protein|tara:strand:- start:293 stop:577 length:285 start_codon:yes stop_codon:yes gene_type:complete
MSLEKENNKDNIDIEDKYSLDFLARFACLYEAVNIACDRAEKLGYDAGKSNIWIKPTAFQKYVQERYGDMKYNMEQNRKGIDTDAIYPWDQVYQ